MRKFIDTYKRVKKISHKLIIFLLCLSGAKDGTRTHTPYDTNT